jgi:hypothetical protein
VWTADRLEKRGWPNFGLCKLYNQTQEKVAHFFFHCRFTIRVWSIFNTWLGYMISIQGIGKPLQPSKIGGFKLSTREGKKGKPWLPSSCYFVGRYEKKEMAEYSEVKQ